MDVFWDSEATGNFHFDKAQEGQDEDEAHIGDDDEELVSEPESACDMSECELETISPEEMQANLAKELDEARQKAGQLSLQDLLKLPWPTYHANGFFKTISKTNHSCVPNSQITFDKAQAQAFCKALCPITSGEEITISYIENNAPFAERRKLLLQYGFECRCKKCEQKI